MNIIIYIAIFIVVVIVFSLGFWAGRQYEKTSLEVYIEDLNFKTKLENIWDTNLKNESLEDVERQVFI